MAKQDVNILEQMNSVLKSEVIEPIKGSAGDILLRWLDGRIKHAKEILKQDGRMTTSMALYQSIKESDYNLSEEGIATVNVIAEDYWKYINYGVNGSEVDQQSTKGWSFKDKAPPRSSMLQYIKDKAITELSYTNAQGNRIVKPLDTPEARNGAAYVFAQSVKAKGIRKTPFIDNSFTDEQIDILTKELANLWQ